MIITWMWLHTSVIILTEFKESECVCSAATSVTTLQIHHSNFTLFFQPWRLWQINTSLILSADSSCHSHLNKILYKNSWLYPGVFLISSTKTKRSYFSDLTTSQRNLLQSSVSQICPEWTLFTDRPIKDLWQLSVSPLVSMIQTESSDCFWFRIEIVPQLKATDNQSDVTERRTSSGSPRLGGQQAFLGLRPPAALPTCRQLPAGTPSPTVQCPGCTPGPPSALRSGWGSGLSGRPLLLLLQLQEEAAARLALEAPSFLEVGLLESSCPPQAARVKKKEGKRRKRRAPEWRQRWRRTGLCAPSAESHGWRSAGCGRPGSGSGGPGRPEEERCSPGCGRKEEGGEEAGSGW